MEEKKVSISQVIAIGGAFMGFVIGSSFASGQECMQYFTGHGVLGSIGAGIIALLLYVWFVCFLQALFPQKCRLNSSKLHGEFPHYCISSAGTLSGAGEEPLQAYKVY